MEDVYEFKSVRYIDNEREKGEGVGEVVLGDDVAELESLAERG
ncbi:hypothetical protein [Staphylococcus epidermidis]|nr:hypothetical protein [Staphylococcus epidermidis]